MSRSILYIGILSLSLMVSCKTDGKVTSADTYVRHAGQTMGTTYHITHDKGMREFDKRDIDSILIAINLSVSTYIDTSTISKINNSEEYGDAIEVLVDGRYEKIHKVVLPTDYHFIKNYTSSERVYLDTDSAFDPTVMPLVNYWGFGYTPKQAVTSIDSQKIFSIMENVGFSNLKLEYNENEMVLIRPTETAIDFSAIAKGYAVDAIAHFLDDQGVSNYIVEIGGEVMAKGSSPKGRDWVVGLNKPDIGAKLHDFVGYVSISDWGMASSGNYRIFHEHEGKKYGHEINPKTGYPEMNEILGVTVIAPTCMEADALATAFMIMGKEKAIQYANLEDGIETIIFTSDKNGDLVSHQSDRFILFQPDMEKLSE